jgi:hypothetical protein
MTNSQRVFTHSSYQAANQAAKQNPGVLYTSDAGDGWTHEVYFCERLNRLVHATVNPNGLRIH